MVGTKRNWVRTRTSRTVPRPGRLITAALGLVLLTSCTSAPAAGPATSVVTSVVTTTAAPSATVPSVVVTVPAGPGAASTTAPVTDVPVTDGPATDVPGTDVPIIDAPTTDAPTTDAPTTPAAPAVPAVTWHTSFTSAATDVAPADRIGFRITNGTLASVKMTNDAGQPIKGSRIRGNTAWAAEPILGYGRTYHLVAVAVDGAKKKTQKRFTFTTLTPGNLTYPTAFPLDGNTVGVGQPVAIYFDEPITDKAAAEKLITVTPSPKVAGSFHWIDDQQVRWRPKNYWTPGTRVKVEVKIYGHDLGGGLYGQQDKTFSFRIGKSKIAYVDDNTKTMVVKFNGKTVKQIPVSMGSDKYPTYNGVHVVAEKYRKKIMDSSTWGLTGTGAYRTEVGWASRISSTGEFVHSAPWSVWAQGSENVSHGCINVSEENAIWFYDNFGPGDIVDISNTVGPPLRVWDGFGDWQLKWNEYRKGSAL
ncbi:hypothetical protein D1871_07435 [Nakamurella silvestris]|nr:hypothetical protein D1871_07435 [Nakamurella silvestris]